MRKELLLILFILFGLMPDAIVLGQFSKDSSLLNLDHYDIESVDVVVKKMEQYQVGSKKENFTKLQHQVVEQGSLTELITRYQPVYIKSDAGGLASFRFRGTSSNHTSVRVRGLELNSQTLGSYNANNAPVFLFDQVELTFGSSSATQGSGSIGGNVRLDLKNNFTNGINGEAKASMGSFGEYMTGAKVFAGNGKFESVTRFVYYEKENDFPFENTAYYDFEKQSYARDTQKNARIENLNLLQQFNYKINEKQVLSSVIWLAKNRHEAQPNMTENINPNTRYIEDQNIRTWLQYDHKSTMADYYIGAGYVFDDAVDYSNKEQKISTQRLVSEAGLKHEKNWLSSQLGIRYIYIVPNVYAYDDQVVEHRTSLYASLLAQPLPWLKASLNLRQQFVTNYNAPFTPALGLEARLWYTDKNFLAIEGNLQRAYRIPTLNDRFWGQEGYDGNKDLKPEDAISTELGLKYFYSPNNHWSLKLKGNAFYMDVDQWIQWTQGAGGWYADNIVHVISEGLELNSNLIYSIGKQEFELGVNYTYNPVERRKSKLETDELNQQLEYAPKNIANAFLQYVYEDIGAVVDANYVGKRNYNQAGGTLDPFNLVNVSAFYKFKIKREQFRIDAQLNNIFSEKYQNQFQYAMPEIGYRIAINYQF